MAELQAPPLPSPATRPSPGTVLSDPELSRFLSHLTLVGLSRYGEILRAMPRPGWQEVARVELAALELFGALYWAKLSLSPQPRGEAVFTVCEHRVLQRTLEHTEVCPRRARDLCRKRYLALADLLFEDRGVRGRVRGVLVPEAGVVVMRARPGLFGCIPGVQDLVSGLWAANFSLLMEHLENRYRTCSEYAYQELADLCRAQEQGAIH